eukprot:3235624-Rhodomonas_salina.1
MKRRGGTANWAKREMPKRRPDTMKCTPCMTMTSVSTAIRNTLLEPVTASPFAASAPDRMSPNAKAVRAIVSSYSASGPGSASPYPASATETVWTCASSVPDSTERRHVGTWMGLRRGSWATYMSSNLAERHQAMAISAQENSNDDGCRERRKPKNK